LKKINAPLGAKEILMAKSNNNANTSKNNNKRGGGVNHPMNMGSVASATASSEAGRERKRREREANERARLERRQVEDKQKAGAQITDPMLLKAACDAILKGIVGLYAIFGIELAVREHRPPKTETTFIVVEFLDALHETGLLRFVQPGTWLPLDLLRKNPERTEWRGKFAKEWEVLSKFLHSKPEFGGLAATMRRQAFAEKMAEEQREHAAQVEKDRESFLASLTPAKDAKPELDLVRDFGPEIFTEHRGLWSLDGCQLKSWTHDGIGHIKVTDAPDGHELAEMVRERIFIKIPHLHLMEQDFPVTGKAALCRELREFLRKELAGIQAMRHVA
jgi:hypothetical protein